MDSEYTTPADAEFIASAREDIPFLLSEINKLQEEIERLRSRPALAPFSGEDVLPE